MSFNASWQHFITLIAALPEATLLVESSGSILHGNTAAEALLGQPSLPARLQDVLSSNAGELADFLRQCTHSRAMVPGAARFTRAQEETLYKLRGALLSPSSEASENSVALLLLQILPDEAPRAQLGECIDRFHREIDSPRQAHNQQRDQQWRLDDANRRKADFLSMMAHELRNPLAPIGNAVQLLKLDPALAPQVQPILERQTQHLNRLVNDLLDASRVEQGKIALRRDEVDLAALTLLECSDLHQQFKAKGVTLRCLPPEAPILVRGDRCRLIQILDNLLANALKFSAAGSSVQVSVRQLAGEVLLEVCDEGIGLAPELLPQLFEAFVQGAQGLDRQQGGLGLGLYLVRSLARLHGGDVDASSPGPGQGACFIVRLPQLAPLPTDRAPARQIAGGKSKLVLVIEDNRDQAETLCLMLEHLGHQVHSAGDGQSGLEEALARQPDVIFCDLGLPRLDGFEVAQRLRQDERTRHILLVAVTGYGQAEVVDRAKRAGFDKHYLKPISLDDIDALISA